MLFGFVFSSSLRCESSTLVSFWLCISLVDIEAGLMKIHYLKIYIFAYVYAYQLKFKFSTLNLELILRFFSSKFIFQLLILNR